LAYGIGYPIVNNKSPNLPPSQKQNYPNQKSNKSLSKNAHPPTLGISTEKSRHEAHQMPRNGSGVFSLPAGSTVTNGDTSDASDLNTPLQDIETDMNTARPIVAGGTGATSASAARVNFGIGSTVESKSSNYTALLSDRSKLIVATSDITLDLTAAATLTDGWYIGVKGSGGSITIDPDGSETINGAATLVVADGRSVRIHCNGTTFYTTSDYSGLSNITYLTSGTAATYTTPKGARALRVICQGGGGGGGGADGQGAGTRAHGAAGGGGGRVEKFISSPATSYTYTVGAGGAGGTAGDNDGSSGGDTTFTDGASLTLSAGGGGGGAGMTGTSGSTVSGTAASSAVSGGDVNVLGEVPSPATVASSTVVAFPSGGGSLYGAGGTGFVFQSDGSDGSGYGAGGGGANSSIEATNRAGGDGSGGLIVIQEYY
jgi:hypothetical protein